MADPVNEQPRPTGTNRLPVLLSEIRKHFGHYRRTREEAFLHVAEMGKLLIEAKAYIDHGDWLAWIKENCPFTDRTAQLYMNLAEGVAAGFGKNENFADSGITSYVAAFMYDLEVRKRQEEGLPDEPEVPPKRPRKQIPWGTRKLVFKGEKLELPKTLSKGDVCKIRRSRNTRQGYPLENHVIYIWPNYIYDVKEGRGVESYNWISLCYRVDRESYELVFGEHETSGYLPGTWQELQEMLERVGHDIKGKQSIHKVDTLVWRNHDNGVLEDALSFWQASILLREEGNERSVKSAQARGAARDETTTGKPIIKKQQLRAAAAKEGLAQPNIKKASARDK